jgi:RNA polymerase sigma-70 factor (ECF subfamily)
MYRAHCGAVRAFVHRRVPPEAADDVVSDVFVAAWRRLEQAPQDELPWLLGIARGVMANRRRAEARQNALHERLAATAVIEVEPGPERRVGESGLVRALASLSDRDQEVLRLVAWDGLDRARAARVLGISTSLFSLQLHRARRRLARALEAQAPAEQQADDQSSLEVL